MSYRDFTINNVQKILKLNERRVALFDDLSVVPPSAWLQETLNSSLALALSSSSEKARSEFIIAPILLEMQKRNPNAFAIYSGERLDIDEQRGLNGECDFILSKGPLVSVLQAPIFTIIEAEKNDIVAHHSDLYIPQYRQIKGNRIKRCNANSIIFDKRLQQQPLLLLPLIGF